MQRLASDSLATGIAALKSKVERQLPLVIDDLELILRGLPPQRMQKAVPETVARYRGKPVDGPDK